MASYFSAQAKEHDGKGGMGITRSAITMEHQRHREKHDAISSLRHSGVDPREVNKSQGRIWAPYILLSIVLTSIILSLLSVNSSNVRVLPESAVSLPTISNNLLNNVTDQVSWDKYSLIIKGQRVFLHSGEFHTFRLPVPSLWPDILQKFQSAGLNAVSVYTHWGLINPSPGVIDLGGFRALQPLFDAAKAAGVWVVLRPGPYINAETTAGGIAHWATSEVAGDLRTNATDFSTSWHDYIHAIIDATVPNQITHGGPVIAIQIDNEYHQGDFGAGEYYQALEDTFKKHGIVVPLTYNDADLEGNFINGTGAVDLYGFDSYPLGFDCSHPDVWPAVRTHYHEYHEKVNPYHPLYIPEFQAGSFDAWGPTAPGYDWCQRLTGPAFENVFYKTLWAANAKMINYYMVYGGTSWGGLPFPGVYTSYDYGSPISENRVLNTKYHELKRQGLFLRSTPDFYMTDWIGNSSTGAVTLSNHLAFAVLLSNPERGANFYITRQVNSSSRDAIQFTLQVNTSKGPIELRDIELHGRQSKLIISNYVFGSSELLYSTASVMFAGRIGNRDVLFLYGNSVQSHEAAILLSGKPRDGRNLINSATFQKMDGGFTLINFLAGIEGLVTVWDSDTQLVLFSDTDTAGTFFSPILPGSDDDFASYWQIGSNSSVLVGGPYLVRSASLKRGHLALTGDLREGVRLVVIAPPEVRIITWNGQRVDADAQESAMLTFTGGFVSDLQTTLSLDSVTIPRLQNWKFSDSLPEIRSAFYDDQWIVANHTSSNIPFAMYYGDGRILYGCDYGFCENIVLWRGHFNASGSEHFVRLAINGGEGFAASVWLNDVFLNTTYGNSTNNNNILEETDEVFVFPKDSVLPGEENVITIVQDNMGLNESDITTNDSKSPRGVRGFSLSIGNFSDWKVQGKVGGYTNFPDKVRGVLNEGGTYGERQGWHLPGFDTSNWETRSLSDGLPGSRAGLGFFVTTFDLDILTGTDIPMSFTFEDDMQPYRAYLFVNGWMMGKRVGNLGPQTKFPVHEGILDYHGTNTVAVLLWSMESDVTISPKLSLTVDGYFEGGIGNIVTNNPQWTERKLTR